MDAWYRSASLQSKEAAQNYLFEGQNIARCSVSGK